MKKNGTEGNALGLIIHDLKPDEWTAVSRDYEGWTAVSDNGTIRPCIGCFSCWNRDPGRCAIRDGYEDMGRLIHEADEVVVMSRLTYGGFSGFVKNVFDRCLGYVLPQFEVTGGETHHKKRYDENKPFTFVFYGPDMSEEEKRSAVRYVTAVCANIRGTVKDVVFRDTGEPEQPVAESAENRRTGTAAKSGAKAAAPNKKAAGKILLLNGSMRFANGNSAKLARELVTRIERAEYSYATSAADGGKKTETVAVCRYLNDPEALLPAIAESSAVVLCVPLYVDGLPAQVIRLLKTAERAYRGEPKTVYVLANMGLYESSQLVNLFAAVRLWCEKTGFRYGGGLGVSAGELIGAVMNAIPFGTGPSKTMAEGMDRLADAILRGETAGEIFAEPWAFPRQLYIAIANKNWDRTARKNGLRPGDLYRRL